MICGYLEAQGIHAVYDKGGTPGLATTWSGPNLGRQEILVRTEDVEAARKALAELEPTG